MSYPPIEPNDSFQIKEILIMHMILFIQAFELLQGKAYFSVINHILSDYGNGISNDLMTDFPSLSINSQRSALYSWPLLFLA